MNRRDFMLAGAASAIIPALSASAAWGEAADPRALAAIREMGLAEGSSEVMSTASYMMDVLGPRLSGSPGIRKSAEWVVEKLKGWGVSDAALAPWPTDPTGMNNGFPRGWANEKFYLHATSPNAFPISGMSFGWTPGTRGLVSGECVLVTETRERDLQPYRGRLRGKWILAHEPRKSPPQWTPLARRLTTEDLDALEVPRPAVIPPDTATADGPSQVYDRDAFFRREGALGILYTNKGHGAFNVYGASRLDPPESQIPRIAILAEHYGRIARSVMQGQPVEIEADIRNAWFDNPEMFNIVGEIRGGDLTNEVVIIGGHFDSFHAATGATDNGGACSVAMEAMRLLRRTGAPLRRSVRICLWNGEEQGLIGSRLYVAQHFGGVRGAPSLDDPRGAFVPIKPAHKRMQAYFNLDNGAGAIRGVHDQGNRDIAPIFRNWLAPLRDLGATHVSQRSSYATDHASFDMAGLPGFQFIQDPLAYEPQTHHTNMDFFEALQPDDMRQNAVILASFALMAANHSTLLPRKAPPTGPSGR